MKTKIVLILILFGTFSVLAADSYAVVKNDNLIQMAILLDTSNSMDGLIEQAKSQLWKIVNEMAAAKRNGENPYLEVALYEYGKSTIPANEGYLRMITPLTTDLDKVSEELFNLKTNGGDEYCGTVIRASVNGLQWSDDDAVLKMIFIAGNEPFTQGHINYREACNAAIQKGIIVNTIFCGNFDEGINTKWKDGALLADGKYMNIDQNQKLVHINAPQDREIASLGKELNRTYISYGQKGEQRKARQLEQDMKASSVAPQVMVQRSITKSSKMYKNESWDLVDAVEDNEVAIGNISTEDLPKEMKNMSKKEQKEYIEAKKKERKKIKAKIKKLQQERAKYIARERKKISSDNTLDQAMVEAIKEQAMKKEYEF